VAWNLENLASLLGCIQVLPQKLASLIEQTPKERFLWNTYLTDEVLGVQVSGLSVFRAEILWIISLWIVGGCLCFGIYLSLMGVCWVLPSNVKDVLVAWRSSTKKSLGVWKMVPLTIWWATRKERIYGFLRTKLCPFKISSSAF